MNNYDIIYTSIPYKKATGNQRRDEKRELQINNGLENRRL